MMKISLESSGRCKCMFVWRIVVLAGSELPIATVVRNTFVLQNHCY